MLITLVFIIEQNCTFNLEVSRLCVSVSSGHLPTGTPCLNPGMFLGLRDAGLAP